MVWLYLHPSILLENKFIFEFSYIINQGIWFYKFNKATLENKLVACDDNKHSF